MPTTIEKPVSREATSRSSGRRINWLAVVGMQVLALLFVEVILWCAGLGEEETVKVDPEIGCVHLTNKRVTWRSEGHSVSYFDGHGMREPGLTVAKPKGVYRIALLGDSTTESLQVPLEETFGKKLQVALKEQFNRPVEVLNFGCSGWSTVQEYLYLKREVFQYSPDLVLVMYNTRDSTENWSPPDQVLTNVRPLGVHLPGGKLIVDNSPVTSWLRTPRAKFLKQCEWLRQNSRIWGLGTALEMDLSLHSPEYKQMVLFVTRPGKAIRIWAKDLKTAWKEQSGKLFGAQKEAPIVAKTTAGEQIPAAPVTTSTSNSQAPVAVTALPTANNQVASETKKPAPSAYDQLIARTMGSVLDAMRQECVEHGAQFGFVALPVRSTVFPTPGVEQESNGVTYHDELAMLGDICRQYHIQWLNCEPPAEKLPLETRQYMFYTAHMTTSGHDFLAKELQPFVSNFLSKQATK